MPITRCIKFISKLHLMANLEKVDVFLQEVSAVNLKQTYYLKLV